MNQKGTYSFQSAFCRYVISNNYEMAIYKFLVKIKRLSNGKSAYWMQTKILANLNAYFFKSYYSYYIWQSTKTSNVLILPSDVGGYFTAWSWIIFHADIICIHNEKHVKSTSPRTKSTLRAITKEYLFHSNTNIIQDHSSKVTKLNEKVIDALH